MTVPHALESKRQFGFLRKFFFFAVPGRALQYMGVHFFLKQLVMDPKTRKLVFNCKVFFFTIRAALSGLLSAISSTNCYTFFPHVCLFIHRPSTPYPGYFQPFLLPTVTYFSLTCVCSSIARRLLIRAPTNCYTTNSPTTVSCTPQP
jgi:hypothetical protein